MISYECNTGLKWVEQVAEPFEVMPLKGRRQTFELEALFVVQRRFKIFLLLLLANITSNIKYENTVLPKKNINSHAVKKSYFRFR